MQTELQSVMRENEKIKEERDTLEQKAAKLVSQNSLYKTIIYLLYFLIISHIIRNFSIYIMQKICSNSTLLFYQMLEFQL